VGSRSLAAGASSILQVPYGLPTGSATLLFTAQGATTSYTIPIAVTSPAIFTVNQFAAAIDSDGTVNGTSAGFGGAIAGSYVSIYMTGGGQVTPPASTGAGSCTATGTLNATVTAVIGVENAPVLYAGVAPCLAGITQVNLSVPSDLISGYYPVAITIGGVTSNMPLLKVVQP
jgi:uncharacterized protein (TIGR03437 family)